MKKIVMISLFSVFILTGCHLLTEDPAYGPEENKRIWFDVSGSKIETIGVKEGEISVIYLRSLPENLLLQENTVFTVGNEKLLTIMRSTNTTVIVRGERKGETVLSAENSGLRCSAIVKITQ